MYIEQAVPALTWMVKGQVEHARMDLVFDLNGSTAYLDVAIVSPFSSCPALVAAASTRPRHMAKTAEKIKFDRYPHVNLVPFILETTGRPGHHAKKFTNNHMRDADDPPLAIRDTWSAIQSVLVTPGPALPWLLCPLFHSPAALGSRVLVLSRRDTHGAPTPPCERAAD